MWTQIRLLIFEQSDIRLHCTSKGLLNQFSGQLSIMIGALKYSSVMKELFIIRFHTVT